MRLSVAVPVYINNKAPLVHRFNRKELLIKCLESIIISVQECDEKIDIFVIDDKSDIELSDMIPVSIQKHVKIIQNKGTKGQSGALNYYLRSADTKFVAITDSDCVVAENWVSLILSKLSFIEGLGLCGPNWRHQYPNGLYGKLLTRSESLVMKHYFLARVDKDGKKSSRFDCRNFILNIGMFEEISGTRNFFVENAGPSVSGISTHMIREKYFSNKDLFYDYSDALCTYHEPITSLKTQFFTYFKRGREGLFNIVYGGKNKNLFGEFIVQYLFSHFIFPSIKNPSVIPYIFFVHFAYWYGIFKKDLSK